jgi:lysophospholipase L1-like esterase
MALPLDIAMCNYKVVLLGDSIRLHYQSSVQKALASVASVKAPSENCETSRNMLSHLNTWVFSNKPDIVHLNCGLHDLRYNPGADSKVVAIEEFANNIDKILSSLTERYYVIWATITPVNEIWHRENKPSRRYESDVIMYNEMAIRIASKYQVQINDLFHLIESNGKNTLLAQDGVHFTKSGYDLLAKQVTSSILESIKILDFSKVNR